MRLIDLTCSKCGATLEVNGDLDKCMCQYCGNVMLIDDEIEISEVYHYHTIENGYEYGYEKERGKIEARKDEIRRQQRIKEQAIRESFKKNTAISNPTKVFASIGAVFIFCVLELLFIKFHHYVLLAFSYCLYYAVSIILLIRINKSRIGAYCGLIMGLGVPLLTLMFYFVS